MDNLKIKISELVDIGLVNEAFRSLNQIEVPEDLQTDLTLLKSRYHENNRRKTILGITSENEYMLELEEIKFGIQLMADRIDKYISFIKDEFKATLEKQSNSMLLILITYKQHVTNLNFKSRWNKKTVFIDSKIICARTGISATFNPVQKFEFFIQLQGIKVPVRLVVIFDFFLGGIKKTKLTIKNVEILETGIEIE
ncbi:MAG: hypothetical protein JNM22_13525 [Saprospiraceae bacterium]|nr:hypothetical protein [Saprospiraceae bacterium]